MNKNTLKGTKLSCLIGRWCEQVSYAEERLGGESWCDAGPSQQDRLQAVCHTQGKTDTLTDRQTDRQRDKVKLEAVHNASAE